MSNPHPHACDRVLSAALEPWALVQPMVPIIAHILGQRLAGDAVNTLALAPRSSPLSNTPRSGVALIPIHGVIAPRMNMLSNISGGATFEEASTALAAAVADPNVSSIVLDIDSPGGSVIGATEFAQRLRKARTVKPIIASANFQMCSAAYWIGANATEVVASPSATLGSIGVYSIHEDLSAALEKMGVKLTFISAGKYKVEGNPAEPLSETARALITKHVEASYNRFVGDVAAGRKTTAAAVRAGFGQGAVVMADEARSLGMVDRIETLTETVDRVLPAHGSPTTIPELAAVAAARQRFALAARH